MRRLIVIVLFCLVSLFFIIYSINFYFLSQINNSNYQINKSITTSNSHPNSNLLQIVESFIQNLEIKSIYNNHNPKFFLVKSKIIKNFQTQTCKSSNFSDIWNVANSWTSDNDNEVFPQYDGWMCKVLQAMQTVPILKAKNSKKGTQLKLVLEVAGNQELIFKPAWYKRTRIIDGPIYSGKDRHNSEIIGFYLGAILNLRWTPMVVGRYINLKEIYQVADKTLQDTMLTRHNDTRICVYGKCFYCRPNELVCGNQNHMVEGVLIFLISGQIKKHKSPWQRTYNNGKLAIWEQSDNNYCEFVKTKLDMTRVLDLIDTAIFDFIIQNGDRHHYETRNKRVILIDNGKGFGNPYVDHLDILAPLYQCCMLRRSTWERLLMFSGGALVELLKELTKSDLLNPVLTEEHFSAINRRLFKLYNVIEYCKETYGAKIFK